MLEQPSFKAFSYNRFFKASSLPDKFGGIWHQNQGQVTVRGVSYWTKGCEAHARADSLILVSIATFWRRSYQHSTVFGRIGVECAVCEIRALQGLEWPAVERMETSESQLLGRCNVSSQRMPRL